MNKTERTMKIEMLKRELRQLEVREPICNNCQYQQRRGMCDKWDSAIPAEVISTGCDEWLDDGIPF